MPGVPLTPADLAAYERDGYLLLRSLFDAGEMDSLLTYARQDEALKQSAYDRKDASGAQQENQRRRRIPHLCNVSQYH